MIAIIASKFILLPCISPWISPPLLILVYLFIYLFIITANVYLSWFQRLGNSRSKHLQIDCLVRISFQMSTWHILAVLNAVEGAQGLSQGTNPTSEGYDLTMSQRSHFQKLSYWGLGVSI